CAVGYGLGRALGPLRLRSIGIRSVAPLARKLAAAGRTLTAIVVLRAMPIAAVPIVDLVCGASRVPLGRFLAGTVLGLAPALVAFSAFGHFLRRALEWRSSSAVVGLTVVGLLAVLAAHWLDRRIDERLRQHRGAGSR